MHLEKLRRPGCLTRKHVCVSEAKTRHIRVERDGTLYGGDGCFMLADERQGLPQCDVSVRQFGRQSHALPRCLI